MHSNNLQESDWQTDSSVLDSIGVPDYPPEKPDWNGSVYYYRSEIPEWEIMTMLMTMLNTASMLEAVRTFGEIYGASPLTVIRHYQVDPTTGCVCAESHHREPKYGYVPAEIIPTGRNYTLADTPQGTVLQDRLVRHAELVSKFRYR